MFPFHPPRSILPVPSSHTMRQSRTADGSSSLHTSPAALDNTPARPLHPCQDRLGALCRLEFVTNLSDETMCNYSRAVASALKLRSIGAPLPQLAAEGAASAGVGVIGTEAVFAPERKSCDERRQSNAASKRAGGGLALLGTPASCLAPAGTSGWRQKIFGSGNIIRR